ncbi:putative carboxylesterase 1 [Silene latifolia]|uniref:putative carboxylesterase 1 n=1 Tax=Silene latifolia TaxID=37657 RepID=UPI003D76EC80
MDFDTEDIDIAHEFFPFLRVYKNGRVERHILTSRVPPGLDPITGTQSKDIIISSDINLSARIFIPKIETPKKLPLLVHFHGGGFCTGSAFCPITKYSLSNFVASAQIVALSVDYRLAPENPLPVAYEDSWVALKWAVAHAEEKGPETWLNEYADFKHVFLGGESSGANIAHHVALRASEPGNELDGFKITGLSLVHPYFGVMEPDKLYQYLSPSSTGSYDDPMLNPAVDTNLGKLACDKVLVCVAGKDMLKGRGIEYYKALKASGFRGKVELVETQGEGHCFHLLNSSRNNVPFLKKLASFIRDDFQKS